MNSQMEILRLNRAMGIWMFCYRKRYQISQDGRIKKTLGANAGQLAPKKVGAKQGKHNLTSFMD